MCKIVEELVDEIRDELIQEGANKKSIAIAQEMIDEGTLTAEQISRYTKLPLDEIKKLIAERNS